MATTFVSSSGIPIPSPTLTLPPGLSARTVLQQWASYSPALWKMNAWSYNHPNGDKSEYTPENPCHFHLQWGARQEEHTDMITAILTVIDDAYVEAAWKAWKVEQIEQQEQQVLVHLGSSSSRSTSNFGLLSPGASPIGGGLRAFQSGNTGNSTNAPLKSIMGRTASSPSSGDAQGGLGVAGVGGEERIAGAEVASGSTTRSGRGRSRSPSFLPSSRSKKPSSTKTLASTFHQEGSAGAEASFFTFGEKRLQPLPEQGVDAGEASAVIAEEEPAEPVLRSSRTGVRQLALSPSTSPSPPPGESTEMGHRSSALRLSPLGASSAGGYSPMPEEEDGEGDETGKNNNNTTGASTRVMNSTTAVDVEESNKNIEVVSLLPIISSERSMSARANRFSSEVLVEVDEPAAPPPTTSQSAGVVLVVENADGKNVVSSSAGPRPLGSSGEPSPLPSAVGSDE
ncbi:unnamed protein product, partial [Amoebophrya sp. A25]|eukprot:GSA25T00003287001.1